MNYLIAADTDKGIKKNINQDSMVIRVANSHFGKILLAVICDGMGGLKKGEMASATVAEGLAGWFSKRLPKLLERGFTKEVFRSQLTKLLTKENEKIKKYGKSHNIQLGTTVSVFLIVGNRYYIIHVGDSRIYEIGDSISLLTQDQTVAGQELSLGRITKEEAKTDIRRHILLQCVGAAEKVVPAFYSGIAKEGVVFLLCSDGFYQQLSSEELYTAFHPSKLHSQKEMLEKGRYLIEQNKRNLEQDNISLALIRTLRDGE